MHQIFGGVYCNTVGMVYTLTDTANVCIDYLGGSALFLVAIMS